MLIQIIMWQINNKDKSKINKIIILTYNLKIKFRMLIQKIMQQINKQDKSKINKIIILLIYNLKIKIKFRMLIQIIIIIILQIYNKDK